MIFSGFRAKFQKRVTPLAFSIKFAKTENKSEICRKFWILWILFTIFQNYSLVTVSLVVSASRQVRRPSSTRSEASTRRCRTWQAASSCPAVFFCQIGVPGEVEHYCVSKSGICVCLHSFEKYLLQRKPKYLSLREKHSLGIISYSYFSRIHYFGPSSAWGTVSTRTSRARTTRRRISRLVRGSRAASDCFFHPLHSIRPPWKKKKSRSQDDEDYMIWSCYCMILFLIVRNMNNVIQF